MELGHFGVKSMCIFCKYQIKNEHSSSFYHCAHNENDPAEEHLYCDYCNHYDPDPDKIELEYQLRERFTGSRD